MEKRKNHDDQMDIACNPRLPIEVRKDALDYMIAWACQGAKVIRILWDGRPYKGDDFDKNLLMFKGFVKMIYENQHQIALLELINMVDGDISADVCVVNCQEDFDKMSDSKKMTLAERGVNCFEDLEKKNVPHLCILPIEDEGAGENPLH